MGCGGGAGDGVKVAAMSPLAIELLGNGIKGAGLAPAVISVKRGDAVAVTVTSEFPTDAGDD